MLCSEKGGLAMKRWKSALTGVLTGILLTACTGYDKDAEGNGITYHITASGRKAFVSEVKADFSLEAPEKTIPETIDKAAVKKLGGFFGTGVPAPFEVIAENEYSFIAYDPYASDFGSPVTVKDVPVTVHLPKSIDETSHFQVSGCYGNRNALGELEFVRPLVALDCDPANPDFYSENGILYSRKDNSEKINLTAREPLAPTLAQRINGRYVKENEYDTEVIEFFTVFDTVFSHSNWYMEGDEYMYSAGEYTPCDPADLYKTDAAYLDVSGRIFSSFAMAGQYTEADCPYYRLEPKENSIVITALDENRQPYVDSGVELERDMNTPSQFPYDFSDWGILFEEGESPLQSYHTGPGRLADGVRESDASILKLHRDGIITVHVKNESPLFFRGIAAVIRNAQNSKSDLCFVMRQVGGTLEPYFGRVGVELKDGDVIVLHRKEGYEAGPLIPEGEASCEYR